MDSRVYVLSSSTFTLQTVYDPLDITNVRFLYGTSQSDATFTGTEVNPVPRPGVCPPPLRCAIPPRRSAAPPHVGGHRKGLIRDVKRGLLPRVRKTRREGPQHLDPGVQPGETGASSRPRVRSLLGRALTKFRHPVEEPGVRVGQGVRLRALWSRLRRRGFRAGRRGRRRGRGWGRSGSEWQLGSGPPTFSPVPRRLAQQLLDLTHLLAHHRRVFLLHRREHARDGHKALLELLHHLAERGQRRGNHFSAVRPPRRSIDGREIPTSAEEKRLPGLRPVWSTSETGPSSRRRCRGGVPGGSLARS